MKKLSLNVLPENRTAGMPDRTHPSTARRYAVWAGLLILGCASAWAADYLSPEYLAASPDGKQLYVTGATSKKVLLVQADTTKKTGEWAIPADPTGIAVAPDGTVYLTAGGPEGVLLKFAPDGKQQGSVRIGHTPLAPVVAPDGKTIYAANRFDNTVSVVDAAAMKVTATVAVLREPHAMALGAQGKKLFVANHLPACKATDDVVAAAVSVIDLTTPERKVRQVLLPNGSTGVRGICAAPDGSNIYVTHTFGRYQLPTTQLERGWMNTAGLSVFNGETGDYINTVLLDDVDLGAANPWGVTVSADGKTIAVAHAGTREVSVIERATLQNQLARAAKNEQVTDVTRSATDVPNDLSFLSKIRRRYAFSGDGPRGILFAGTKLFTALYFADALGVIDLAPETPTATVAAIGPAPDLSKDRVRRGEMLWNDGTMCFQQWQSCASCHPDARGDALNWDLLNDGMGNPKQSKSLIYCHLTPPVMVTGIRPSMKACNRKGINVIQFVIRPEEDALCIDDYVISLKPVPSPVKTLAGVNKAVADAIKRGEKLYQQAGCAQCHPAEKRGPNGEQLFTDLRKYDVGLGVDNEKNRAFDTPSLVEVWRTAPYLYDGRATTIEEVLTTCNPNDAHGKTKGLSPEQIKDLATYIRSL